MAKRKKNQNKTIWLALAWLVGFILLITTLVRGNDVILFNPKGYIAGEQHRLMLTATLIMLGFALVILFFLYLFAWKYRESNVKAQYVPEANRSKLLVFTAWASPFVIFLILASIMIPATFRLEPQDDIKSEKDPIIVQVVALRWKWLFIYPEQNIATVNFLQIPEDTPIQFDLTADEAPMNSFWIPHLGGQLYAMTEHVNRLNLMADTPGDYTGSAAEINGHGFAGMRFITRVSTQADFDNWLNETRQSQKVLNKQEYANLLKPSERNEAEFYAGRDQDIFNGILNKYAGSHHHSTESSGYSEQGAH
jgi:cytochrome o ubiquinol oxidase subunit 2